MLQIIKERWENFSEFEFLNNQWVIIMFNFSRLVMSVIYELELVRLN